MAIYGLYKSSNQRGFTSLFGDNKIDQEDNQGYYSTLILDEKNNTIEKVESLSVRSPDIFHIGQYENNFIVLNIEGKMSLANFELL